MVSEMSQGGQKINSFSPTWWSNSLWTVFQERLCWKGFGKHTVRQQEAQKVDSCMALSYRNWTNKTKHHSVFVWEGGKVKLKVDVEAAWLTVHLHHRSEKTSSAQACSNLWVLHLPFSVLLFPPSNIWVWYFSSVPSVERAGPTEACGLGSKSRMAVMFVSLAEGICRSIWAEPDVQFSPAAG